MPVPLLWDIEDWLTAFGLTSSKDIFYEMLNEFYEKQNSLNHILTWCAVNAECGFFLCFANMNLVKFRWHKDDTCFKRLGKSICALPCLTEISRLCLWRSCTYRKPSRIVSFGIIWTGLSCHTLLLCFTDGSDFFFFFLSGGRVRKQEEIGVKWGGWRR